VGNKIALIHGLPGKARVIGMTRLSRLVAMAVVLLAAPVFAWGDDVLLIVEKPPVDGLVVAHVDLTTALQRCKQAVEPAGLRASTGPAGQNVPIQLVPDADYDAEKHVAGTLILHLPAASDGRVRLVFTPGPAKMEPWNGRVAMRCASLTHDAKRQGGFPSQIAFADGKTLDSLRWNDRLYDPQLGVFSPAADPQAKVTLVAKGPLATAVRVTGRYVQADGKAPPSAPQAVYDWLYLANRPLALVRATITQKETFSWPEVHFLELNYPREAMPQWAGGEPMERGRFTASNKSFGFSQWGAILDGPRAIGMFQCGRALCYDGGPGTYLHAHGDAAWQPWGQTRRDFSAWLWIGIDPQPAEAIRAAAVRLLTATQVTVTVRTVRERIEQARSALAALPLAEQQAGWWRIAGAEQCEVLGRFEDALQAASGQRPAGWTVLSAGDLGLILQRSEGGVRLASLYDSSSRRQLLAPQVLPLLDLTLRHVTSKEMLQLKADAGWTDCEVTTTDAAKGAEIRWQRPAEKRLDGLRVVAQVLPGPTGAFHWRLKVEGVPAAWSVWKARFPQLAVADLGPQAKVLLPRGAGELQQDLWQRSFQYRGTYPSGWTSMQLLAAYDAGGKAGLYVGMHDPLGSTKDILVESRPAERAVTLAFEHPAANMGVGGNGFELTGEAVWQLLHGDWFDAAVIYRDWVRRSARWYPRLGPEGREDTPLWMRELSAWAQCGGAPSECAARVKEFQKYLGVPIGFHWYSWHQIPFDNDYPHYFPAKPGFAGAVRDLQASGVYVMPYINGRLWDTHDRGREDFEFTRRALPAATKDEQGKPYIEMYGSKESDGSPVRLAVMCPTTELWRGTMRATVLRLFGECGVKGVYIDQVAAAQPQLCFDRTHGHPLGGGHWWTEGYWALIASIRKAKPADCMLTTECNAEPYTQVFDGYLTWHWQYDGQVPVFPAVYGGAIQMFGRAYRDGPSKDLALRMKAGQQLVYGEQIGWLDPAVVQEKGNAEFLREVVRLRHALRRYFYAGEMARPPRLLGTIPRVTADWQWSGPWPVTTDALLAGAWQVPKEKKLVLLLVNVSDEPVQATLDFDAARYDLPAGPLALTRIGQDGPGESESVPKAFQRAISAGARQAWAWEIAVP
jgi:hypothetical protein